MSNKNANLRATNIYQPKIIFTLLLIWSISFVIDRIWFSLDHRLPSWDPADYLNGVMLYRDALSSPDFFNTSWWREFWLLSNKIPPLIYIITGAFWQILSPSVANANLVFSFINLILIVALFYLGKLFFNDKIALFSCALIQLVPGLYFYRREFLLDFPLTVIVLVSFTSLSYWYFTENKTLSWCLSLLTGIFLGFGLLLKQPFLFFLFFPLVFATITCCWQRHWSKIAQLLLMSVAAIIVFYPWYRTNWLVIFTSGKRATIDSAILEGDPPLNTLQAWTFYGEVAPYLLSVFLLLVSLFGLVYLLLKYRQKAPLKFKKALKFWQRYFYQRKYPEKSTLIVTYWLIIFVFGGYLLSSLNVNKDARYILPLVPVLTLLISAFIYSYQGQQKNIFRIGVLTIAFCLMLFNLFPLGGSWLTVLLSPKMQHHPYTGEPWATPKVIDAAIATNPYLRMNIGVLPSTNQINQSNISFYGSIPDFQVYGRQVGVREEEVAQDVNALDWFITKTGDQGSIPASQPQTVELVEKGGQFNLLKQWSLPDQSLLKLYQKKELQTIVNPLNTYRSEVKLDSVIVPEKIKPGQVIDITYNWSGTAENLQNAIVLLSWYSDRYKESTWNHDHAIGMSNLHFDSLDDYDLDRDFQVRENTAMFVPENIADGDYILNAIYLDQNTGKTFPLPIPQIQINVDSTNAPALATREPDLVNQINLLAPQLAQGIPGLEAIFAHVGRINQYDPTQAYLKVTEKALQARLQNKNDLDYLYTLLLSQVLQQNVNSAIATAQRIVKLAPDNAYNHAYLSFLYLYDWKGKQGQNALQPALKLAPDVIEFQYLQGVSALLQGQIGEVWKVYQAIK